MRKKLRGARLSHFKQGLALLLGVLTVAGHAACREKRPIRPSERKTERCSEQHSRKSKKSQGGLCYKPVIYLYPEEATDVSVRLDYSGKLTCTYPAYANGWELTAYPDGRLRDKRDGRTYSYLFWEGVSSVEYDMSRGFVVKGEDTAAFLQEKLAFLGLTPREYNEFIVFWLPKMQDNPYNLITFQGACYQESAKLSVIPEPDSVLRVFMAYKPLDAAVAVEEPLLEPFERKGFSVVEWGGTEVR